jgi:hypothetical protein
MRPFKMNLLIFAKILYYKCVCPEKNGFVSTIRHFAGISDSPIKKLPA